MPDYKAGSSLPVDGQGIADLMSRYVLKFAWFYSRPTPYKPHYWQTLFHANTDPTTDRVCRYRHLVAGRRGGKTLSAAWDTLYYFWHPQAFHMDHHGIDSSKPLHGWVLTEDYPLGMAALMTFRETLAAAGLVPGEDYKEHRGNRYIEFKNGSFLQFKTADNPEMLRGAGLDWLWMDEAAFISQRRAWEVSRPALADKIGRLVTTTTPNGKNWLYDEFWTGKAVHNPAHGRVEYRSLDNPYFATEEWQAALEDYHPMLFRQEFMASFDSMAGKELSGDWLKYYEIAELPRKDASLPPSPENLNLNVFVGVDPAISLADTADRFAITAIGVTSQRDRVYLLDQWAGRLPFPEQVDKINEWFIKWRPHYIGIEKVAYQAALAQQVSRLEGFPPVVPIIRKGKKFERILSMAPLFRIGKVRVRKEFADFINEWVDYDSTLKNPKDDCLDSMEITLSLAGVLLPNIATSRPSDYSLDQVDNSIEAIRRRDLPTTVGADASGMDEHLGADW
jgi:phage terminase large subunit-like protein